MFDHRHYVPVLRWKRSEWKALEFLDKPDRDRLTPILEYAPKDFLGWASKSADFVEDKLLDRAEKVSNCWGPDPVFLDLGLLDSPMRARGDTHPVVTVAKHLAAEDVKAIPVIGIARGESYLKAARIAVRELGFGVAIRLSPKEAMAISSLG